tara:strand:- start:355 stop:516 length:162 start_codon:yes stop_codon:yes gene_type:complete
MIIIKRNKGGKVKNGASKVIGLGSRPDYQQQRENKLSKYQVQQSIVSIHKSEQ